MANKPQIFECPLCLERKKLSQEQLTAQINDGAGTPYCADCDEVMLVIEDEKNPNTNVLAGFKCPECGSFSPFRIEMTAVFDVTDDGTEVSGDSEWNDDSYCMCVQCEHSGIVEEFRTDDDPTSDVLPHAKDCARQIHPMAECTCFKSLEVQANG